MDLEERLQEYGAEPWLVHALELWVWASLQHGTWLNLSIR